MTKEEVASRVKRTGPSRVVINADGEAIGSHRARTVYGVTAEVVFLRRDGWSLGAPAELGHVAYKMWPDEWVGALVRPERTPITIDEYAARFLGAAQ